ncbi:MAG: tail fiber domain-containing protein [Flavobacterium sp.]|nr:tail fiber domain-containing protein [Flavobacterium sp.]
MKKVLLLLFLFHAYFLTAQVGINTTTPNAQLDIKSSSQVAPSNTDGILIPKIDVFPAINPTAAQQGMLVYLTTTTTFLGNSKVYGFYYWDTSSADWIAIGNNNSNSWNTAGNSGTNPSSNFIGTTDNADVVFRRNFSNAGLIGFGNTGFGNNSMSNPVNIGNSAFGSFSLAQINLGRNNTAIGHSSLNFNQNGNDNIALGFESLYNNRASNNLAIGNQALYTNTTGEFNIAIGNSSLQFINTDDNTAIGFNSQSNNITGSENVSLGKNSLIGNINGDGNTAVGNNSLAGGHSEYSTAVGYRALVMNNSFNNTAIGSESMMTNTIGRANTAVGNSSLNSNINGENNTAIGINSLKLNSSGNNNTAVGSEATTMANNLTNATAIGANAIVGDSNSMVLGSVSGFNGSFNDTKVGIGTVFPLERLHIVGKIRMEDGNQGIGKLLASDNNGVATWQDATNLAWGISGNSGTNPLLNYIGTSDFTDVVFKRGNIPSGIISTSNTSFGFNNLFSGNNNSVFGAEALSGSGQDNSAFGYQALHTNSTGVSNSAFGASALFSNNFGTNNVGIGFGSMQNNTAGSFNTSIGSFSASNLTIGINNTSVGSSSLKGIVSGNNNSALGSETNFGAGNLTNSTAIGAFAQVDASNSMVLGGVNGINGATSNVNVGIGTTTPLDRLHVVGNLRMVDGNQATGKVLTSDANGTATWTAANTFSSGTLDQAYDFGGAGLGKTITADSGAVLINGTDGLVVSGFEGSGVVAPSGAGTRMVWNPRKGALRAGSTLGTAWDDTNIGLNSTAFGFSTIASGVSSTAIGHATNASGSFSTALGFGTTAVGNTSTAFGNSTSAANNNATAFGASTIASGASSTAFGSSTTASGITSTAFGSNNIASGNTSTVFGSNNIASGSSSTAFGFATTAAGTFSTTFGFGTTAPSFGEVVLGIGATNYTPSVNGATQFRVANVTDRLLVVGNAIDANNNGGIDGIERSDALVILKNGNTGIGSSTPADKLHVVGNIRMVDGNQAAGRVLTSDANGTATWQNASGSSWGISGNSGTNPATNFVGTTDVQPLRFRVANTFAGNISNTTNGLVSLGLNAGPSNTGLANTFIGGTAGALNTSGASNTFLGQGAGAANATSSFNTYLGTGAGQSNATGSQNVYIGRLAGASGNTGSDNILIGNGAGLSNTANNNIMIGSFAGNGSTTGGGNTFLGTLAGIGNSTGGQNTFIGASAGSTNNTGAQNTLIGNGAALNASNLTNATAIGRASRVDVNDGLVLGSVNGINAATSTSLVGIGTTAPLDRLHVVGNIRMVDGNQAAGNVLISDANGTASWASIGAATAGTLDESYDFGGAGVGRTITADTGAVTIAGTDGLVSTGTLGSGALVPAGASTRMVWNPRKAAFRAGSATGTQWDDANIGANSVAFGNGTTASGASSMAFGNGTSAAGQFAFAAGTLCSASGSRAVAFGNSSSASGFSSTAFGDDTTALGFDSTSFGAFTFASAIYSTAFGFTTTAEGSSSTAFGVLNTARSFGETTIGIGATNYVPTTNATSQFRVANATDRLFVIGNAIDSNNNDIVDAAERSDALVILKNGNTGIGNSAPVERLHVAGRSLFTNGFSADNAALIYRNNTDYMFLGPQSGSSANGAALALFGSTNVSGGNAGGVDFNVPNGQVRMNHTNGNFNFSANSTSGYNANFEINDVGLQIGHNSASRAVVFRTASTERMRLTAAGDFGIGTTTPAEKLHISGPAGLTAVRIGNTSAIGATSNVALDFFRNTGINTDWRIYNIGANLTIGNSADDLATVNDLYQFQASRFMPMNDGTQNLGQAANRWNTLFATNGTINTSDRREKKEIQPLQYGLNQLMQLKPVTFKWNNPQIDNSNKHLGFIAQDLQEVIPEVVVDSEWIEVEGQGKVWKKTPLLGVNYAEVIPVLVRSIQEQQSIIESQKKEIEQQKKLLESVMQRLTKMEQR